MKREIHKYPYNGRIEDEIKIFLSDQICEQVVSITYRNRQFFCTIKDKITHKKREIAVSAVFILTVLFGIPKQVGAIGVGPIVTSAPEIHRPAPQHFRQYAPTVNPRLDKIYFMPNKETIPLIYLNAKNVYINERVLKRLRAGGFEETLVLMAIGVIVFLTFQLSGTNAFAILEQFVKLNAPTTNPGLAPGPGQGVISKPVQRQKSTAVQLYAPSHTQASTFVNGDQSVNLDLGYQEVVRRARYSDNFDCSFNRFRELAAEDGQTTTDSMRAAISALQLEADGAVSNVRRDPVAKQNGIKAFDFLADGPNGETHLEIKGPVGSEIRKTAGLGPSVTKQGKKIGYKTKSQLNYWFNPTTDTSGVTQPPSRDKVFVATDLFDVPVSEKAQMISAIEDGLKGSHPVLFFNNILNR